MLAIVDSRISPEIEASLSPYADEIIKLPPYERLAAPVSAHPDMLIFVYGKRIFTWQEYLAQSTSVFARLEAFGYMTECIEERASEKYPYDVRLNSALVGDTLITNGRTVSATLTRLAKNNRIRLAHTNQGYAKCSTAIVSEDAIITSDPSVYTAAAGAGLDVLRIREGHVRLDGYGTGFIGGASGVCGDKILFCGDLSLHPDEAIISEFCRIHGKEAVSLSHKPLYDYGTLLLLPKKH